MMLLKRALSPSLPHPPLFLTRIAVDVNLNWKSLSLWLMTIYNICISSFMKKMEAPLGFR
uniref:Uncharacterized protein n=1 Tax=Rhizophora mucronata TaxID=61149 RepID=A0A2P2JYK9_RHIMU